MKFNSINSHLWRTQWAMGTELDPGWQGGWAPGASPGTLQRKGAPGHAARTPSPEAKGQRKFLGRSPFEMTSLAGKKRYNTSGWRTSKNSGIKDVEREAEELNFSL